MPRTPAQIPSAQDSSALLRSTAQKRAAHRARRCMKCLRQLTMH